MKRYKLTCPHCKETGDVMANTQDPDVLHCLACNEDINLDDMREIVDPWMEYIKDHDAMVNTEEQEQANE